MVSEQILTVVATLLVTTVQSVIVGWLWKLDEKVEYNDNCPVDGDEESELTMRFL